VNRYFARGDLVPSLQQKLILVEEPMPSFSSLDPKAKKEVLEATVISIDDSVSAASTLDGSKITEAATPTESKKSWKPACVLL
jgi:hypothetical protein